METGTLALGEWRFLRGIRPVASTLPVPRQFAHRRLAASLVGGVQFAAAIALGYALAYLILEAGRLP